MTAMTPLSPLIEWQMKNFIKAEGFPDKEGWSPQYKITENYETGEVKVQFTDQKSIQWFKDVVKRKKLAIGAYKMMKGIK